MLHRCSPFEAEPEALPRPLPIRYATGSRGPVENVITRAIAEHYLTEERPSGKQVHCNVIGMLLDEGHCISGTGLPSERTMYRRIAALDPYVVALKRNGKRHADMRFRAATSTVTVRLKICSLIPHS